MSSVVVYQGDGDYEGTLFNGLRFWVSVKVPARESFVQKLKNNGGKIVLLENRADILIADNIRKDVPEGSVSWKWIDECIKEGKICDINKHKKIKTVQSGRPGVSSTGPKGTRTKFTDADDKILIKWVVQQEAAGKRGIQGNTIYDELAAINPRHTSQSWRDRWVKRYQVIPREKLPYLDDANSPPPPTAQESSVIRPARLPTRPVAVSPSIPLRGQSNTPKKRVAFTEEDDIILKRYVFERVRAGVSALGNTIYKELEEEYPHHTFNSWLSRANRLGIPQAAIDACKLSPVEEVVSTRTTTNRPRVIVDLDADKPTPQSSVVIAGKSRNATAKISAATQEFIREQQNEQAARARSRTTENPELLTRLSVATKKERLRMTRAAKLIQRVWRGYRVRRDLWGEEEEDNYQAIDHDQEDRQVANQDDQHEDGELDELDELDELEELGYKDDELDDQDDQDDQDHKDDELEDKLDDQEDQDDQDDKEEDKGPGQDATHQGKSLPPPQISQAAPKIKNEPNEMVRLPDIRNGPTADEVKFYEDLLEYYDYESIRPIKTVDICVAEPMIVPLWELWRRATADHSSHECRNWEDIATALGIDWFSFPDVTNQLKSAFDKHLLGYEVKLKEWKENFGDEDDSAPDESFSDGNSKKVAPLHASSPPKGPDLPSSPPTAGLKRKLGHPRDSPETADLGLSAKRRRFSLDDEIPCSPEADRPPDRPTIQLDSSPQRLPFLPRLQKKVVEPETQDFDFDNRGDDPLGNELTPSQQLRSEMSHQHGNGSPVSDSSESFDPPVNRPRPGPAATARSSTVCQEPRRRVLPPSFSRASTNKSPANTNQQRANPLRRLPASMSPAVQTRPAAQPQRKSTPAGQHPRETPKASSPALLASQRPRETPKASSPPRPTVTFKKYPSTWQTTVEHYMALGYPERIVRASLEATTFDTGEAAQVMERLKERRGIPKNARGVWTDEDNEGLLLLDSAACGRIKMGNLKDLQKVMDERERLDAKHESKRVRKRCEYLGLRMWSA